MQENIRVTFFGKIKKKNDGTDSKTIGLFGIYIPIIDMYLTDLKLIDGGNGGTFIAPPAEASICEKTGKKVFQNLWWFGKKTNARFQAACHEALALYFQNHPEHDPRAEGEVKKTTQQQETV